MSVLIPAAPEEDEGSSVADHLSAIVPTMLNNARLDKALATLCPNFSRTRLKSLIEGGECLLNGEVMIDASWKVKSDDTILISLPPLIEAIPEPENIPLNIVFEDEHLIVLNKEAGMVVHPAVGNESGTLVNAILYHCGASLSGINGVKRPGIVHRLDKDTTGLMIVAKTDHAHHHLSAQLQDRSLSRVYRALVFKAPFPHKGEIDFPVGRHPSNRLRMAVIHKGGREALTFYDTVENFDDALALVECRLATGRTHQIRVHFEKFGHPLIGDPVYGIQATALRAAMKKSDFSREAIDAMIAFKRPALHAKKISFIHPHSGERMTFDTDMPEDFALLLEAASQG